MKTGNAQNAQLRYEKVPHIVSAMPNTKEISLSSDMMSLTLFSV